MAYATAIQSVTKFICALLRSRLIAAGVSANPVVSTLAPGADLSTDLGVNVYLYRVQESPFTRNQDWRGNRKTPPAPRPVLGLQLSYLLTPLGKPSDGDDTAHHSLGAVMLALQENPILNDVHFVDLDADKRFELEPSILESYEKVKVSLLPMGVEEISRIWSTLSQPFRLSVAYEVSLVELTPTPPSPPHGGIVLRTDVEVITLDPPRLSTLTPAVSALGTVVGDQIKPARLTIEGFGMSFPGLVPLVRVGSLPVDLDKGVAPTGNSLAVLLPTDLSAGPQIDVTVTLKGKTSTPLTFIADPWLDHIQPIRTALDRTVVYENGKFGDLKLLLTGRGFGTSPAVRFEKPGSNPQFVKNSVTVTEQGKVAVDLTGLAGEIPPVALENGLYQVRVVKDDVAKSATNPRTLEVLPRVEAPAVGIDLKKIVIKGERLGGADVRLLLDGVSYGPFDNSLSPTQFERELSRPLTPGMHRASLSVGGVTSRYVDFEVPNV